MKTIESIDFKDKRALIRVDFNVSLDNDLQVTDDTRIRAAIPTLKYILKNGGSIVLMSHLGRPKGKVNLKYSLAHIINNIKQYINVPIHFATDCISDEAFKLSSSLKSGEILLLENLRFYNEEENGDTTFAKKISEHGHIYINDAFGTAHRAHASTTVVAEHFDNNSKCFGYVMANEIININKAIDTTDKPFTAIVGGSKVSDKIKTIDKLLNNANNILIGGGMTFTFIKALGGNIGNSLCELDKLDWALTLLDKAKKLGVNIVLPSDVIVADKFANDANIKTCDINNIPDGWMGLDIHKQSLDSFKQIILASKVVLWNGPMGVFEMPSFENGTKEIAYNLVEATKNGAFTLIGGGDSVAAINKFNLQDKVSYVSTGGGAMLEYIEEGTLPGIEAIK